MQINSPLDPTALYRNNQTPPPAPSQKDTQDRTSPPRDQAVTVAISPEAQALQKVAAVTKTEESQKANDALLQQSQTRQQQQNQTPAGQSPRINLTV